MSNGLCVLLESKQLKLMYDVRGDFQVLKTMQINLSTVADVQVLFHKANTPSSNFLSGYARVLEHPAVAPLKERKKIQSIKGK